MRRLLLLTFPVCVLVVSFLVQRAADQAEADAPASSSDPVAEVESYLRAERAALDIPGMALALVRNGHVERLWADGESRPGVAMTPDTPVLLASVSKSLTAVGVMQLVDAGKLALDASVVTYLPWFTTRDSAMSDKITVAQLLHHSSGLADGVDTDGALMDDQSAAALERGVRMLAKVDLQFPPGSDFVYSNLNYNVLGLLVQSVSGKSYADYMREEVFDRIGMKHATADPTQAAELGAADGYYRWFGMRYFPTGVPQPARSAPSATTYASASDLAAELLMNLGGGRLGGSAVLSRSAVNQLHRPGARADPFVGYAMGWFVRPLWETAEPNRYAGTSENLPLVWEHSGEWSTTVTYVAFSPALHRGFALVMNCHDRAASSKQYALTNNVWRILAHNSTLPLGGPTEDFLTHYGTVIALTLLAIQLAVLVQTVIEVRRRRRASRRRRFAVLGVTLVLDLSFLAFVFLYLPGRFDAPVNTIVRSAPDVGVVILAAVAVIALWSVPRTLLLARSPRATTGAGSP